MESLIYRIGKKYYYLILIILLFVYLLITINSVLYTRINFDEGSYAYKGWQFIYGNYKPFQDYGLLTNKMPLAFLVPGIFYRLFPGILTGRLLAATFGLIGMIGLYLFVIKSTSRYLGLLIIAIHAFSLSTITNYSMAITQSFASALLIWAFYFVVHDEGAQWKVYFGCLLLQLAIFTRQNLVFVLPVIWLYIITNKKVSNNYYYSIIYLFAFIASIFHIYQSISYLFGPFIYLIKYIS